VGFATLFLSIHAFISLLDRFQRYARDLTFPEEPRLPLLCIALAGDEPAFSGVRIAKGRGVPRAGR
jgi:hypothetical protein